MKTELREDRKYFDRDIVNDRTKKRTTDFFDYYKKTHKKEETEEEFTDKLPEYDYAPINSWLGGLNDDIETNHSSVELPYINKNDKDIVQELKLLLNMFKEAGINVKVTSGYREGAIMADGRPSLHASGQAVDIVPVDGNYGALDLAIANNPKIMEFMTKTGIGIYRETDPEVMKQTGATGPHYHMGIGAGKNYLESIKHLIKEVTV